MLIEADILFAHIKKSDPLKEAAEKVLRRILDRDLRVEASSEVVDEVVIWHKSRGYVADHIKTVLSLISAIPIDYVPLTPEIAITALILTEEHGLSYFDSFHAATAISRPDKTIISSDEVFDGVPGLRRIHPRDL
ncbi:MAG: type II toxin-antitoxin system VapC family toxin [Candidatus Geothermarchaeales archaeon]